ncbi:hypothetical protein Gpo141_00001212 [Globisporangium polare]
MLGSWRLSLACLALASCCAPVMSSRGGQAASRTQAAAAKKQIVYDFDRDTAAGIQGAITIEHNHIGDEESAEQSAASWILASLDFSALDMEAVRKSDPQCKDLAKVHEFQYHIHVDWNASPRSKTSDSFAGCAKPITGNHYDPNKACGPSSEYAGTPQCEGKTPAQYKCTPAVYVKDPLVCEKGDLSGKVGNLVLGDNDFASGEWKDPHFPLYAERKPHWSIVLHAVCGSATPRVACAVGVEAKPSDENDGDDTPDEYTGEYEESYEWIDELRG